jgi:hypothetical protein
MREGKEASLVNNAHNEMVRKGLKGYVAGAASNLFIGKLVLQGMVLVSVWTGEFAGKKGTAASY